MSLKNAPNLQDKLSNILDKKKISYVHDIREDENKHALLILPNNLKIELPILYPTKGPLMIDIRKLSQLTNM